ncbi:MAG: TatD family hydrolase [Victivallales bacterium]|nr:TatD family hydrolase [Victivallales bacterium]
MHWFDSHCHFDIDKKETVSATLASSREAGVLEFLVQGTNMENCPFVVELAERETGAYAAVGMHPHDAEKPYDLGLLRELWQHEKVLAVGEIGLDYFYDFAPRESQRAMFAVFLQEAVTAKLPVIIHCREAVQDGLQIVKDNLPKGHPFEVHSFSGTEDEAAQWLEMGAMMSINGMVTFKKAENIRRILELIPNERLLLETDTPYLAPVPLRGQENTPANIPIIGKYVAELRGIAPEEMARLTTENTHRFLNIQDEV